MLVRKTLNGQTLCRLVSRHRPHLLAIACAVITPLSARAATLFYNGDYNLNDAAKNQNNVPINVGGTYQLEKALVYDDFIVPSGQTWKLTSVFSNNQIAYSAAPATAVWEIRSGMSAGNGGTIVASGDTTATVTTETAADGNNYIDPEFQIAAAVPTVTLAAGTYWVAVAPDSAGYYGDQSYNETTSGANAVGTPPGNNGRSFLFDSLSGPGNENFVASNLDYSAGVVGTITFLPEPAVESVLCLAGAFYFVRRPSRSNQNTLLTA